MKGDVKRLRCQGRFFQQAEFLPPKKDFMIAGAKQGRVENVIILQPDFRRLGLSHPACLLRAEQSIPITGLFKFNVMIMNVTTLIQIIPPRVGEDMDAFVERFSRADKSLPLHQFNAEFPGKGAGEKVPFAVQFLPQAGQTQKNLLRQRIFIRIWMGSDH